jgi:hypothetical protein
VIGALLLAAAGHTEVAIANGAENSGFRPAEIRAPWTPSVIEDVDPYIPDPALFGGNYAFDHFAGSSSVDYSGWIAASLSNGDILEVGLVPAWGASNSANGLWNLGLVRYTAASQRGIWTNAGNYGFYADEYLVYPNIDPPPYQYLRDVKVQNGWIYILVDVQQQNQQGLGRQDVRIIQVREDGSSFTEWPVFGYPPVGGDDPEDFYGSQMVPMSSDRMIVAATGYDTFGAFVAVSRLAILGNGAVSLDNGWGAPYGGDGSFDRLIHYYAPSDYCAAGLFCSATAGFAVTQTGGASVDFYVAGSRNWDGDNWDPYALKISSETGNIKPEFTPDGWSSAPFDEPNSHGTDYAAGLYVYQNEVYLAAQVDRGCHPGIGVAKLDGATGEYNEAFGDGGKIVFGGVSFDDPGCSNFPYDHIPLALSATGGRLGIVGYNHWTDQGSAEHFDPMLAVVDAVGGSVLSFGRYPARRADGSRLGDAILGSVFGGPSPASPFTVGGQGRDESTGNRLSFLVGRFIPVSSDRIFASNMGGNP